MEEKNELNDIILNKSGSGSSTKKLLLAIAALTLILIIVLVIMNSLKTQSDEQAPHAAVPPEPSSPTEVIDDPLFEPVEVIQEGGNTSASADLGEIAQKIKQESFQSAPEPAPAPVVEQIKPAVQSAPAVVSAPKAAPKPAPKPVVTAPKAEAAPKAVQPVVNTPTIKKSAPTEPKKAVVAAPKAAEKPVEKAAAETAAKPAAKAVDTEGTYYIQVGSFTKQPNQALFDRLNASGLKYITAPSGEKTKVLVGPFQGEKAARDVLGTVKRNIESGAYITKG
ncbi:SPOR domain-containing protein [Sulfuricurvum sp.]|uniref:SPOR domain-containing protein n=1 Tax=Sulfuricurvum sp. TaxID=2025608 RepID=UPI003BB0C3A0